jgi:hypothetical protein
MNYGHLFLSLSMILAALILGRWPVIRLIVQSVRTYPKEHRWKAIRRGLGVLVTPIRHYPRITTSDEQAFRSPDEPVRTVSYDQWPRVDSLVGNIRNVTSASSRSEATSLDIDGCVAVLRHRDEITFDIDVVAPDGATRRITAPDGIVSAASPWPSIDHGTVAWWQVALDGKTATLWVAQPGLPARQLHTEQILGGEPLPFAPSGWVRVAGDQVAWTMLPNGKVAGIIGVTTIGGTTHHLGTTRFATIHRDAAAELHGRRVFAVNLADGEPSIMGRVAEVDLDGPVPTIHILRAGAYPGASVCNGFVVGFWSRARALQLPGGLSIRLLDGMAAADIVSDGEWCAGRVFNPPDSTTKKVSVGELFHLPSGTKQRLTDRLAGIVDIRAGRVLWSWFPSDEPRAFASSWVGELRAPSPQVDTEPTQAPPAT